MKLIKAKAVVVIEHESKYLFTVCTEQTTGSTYYIPVGGGIKFCEYSSEAAKREVLKEMGLEIENLALIDISENVFTYNGVVEHEIIFVYKGKVIKDGFTLSNFKGKLNDKGDEIKFALATVQEIRENETLVYPFGLLKTLEKLVDM
jgi:ADP-ribose pyrophosphatase YjhB (NUDIX family)